MEKVAYYQVLQSCRGCRRPEIQHEPQTSERAWSVPVLVAVAERGRCFAFVTRPDAGPYVRWAYRLEPSGAGTRVPEIWDVEPLPPAMQHATQEQLDARARYTEGMLTTTLAALKATVEG